MFDAETGQLTLGDASSTLALVGKSEPTGREIEATLRTRHVAAAHAFHELAGIADFETLGQLLASFAENWRGWEGERKWQSADDDFSLVCTHDRVSGVRVAVYLFDYVEGWELGGVVVLLEAGRLQELADEVHEFMASLPSNTNDP